MRFNAARQLLRDCGYSFTRDEPTIDPDSRKPVGTYLIFASKPSARFHLTADEIKAGADVAQSLDVVIPVTVTVL